MNDDINTEKANDTAAAAVAAAKKGQKNELVKLVRRVPPELKPWEKSTADVPAEEVDNYIASGLWIRK